ncbi:casA, partial [Symbiodinium microadriaticum]
MAPVHRRNPHPIRRALLIGINYHGQSGELKGCVCDTAVLRALLVEVYAWPSTPDSIRILTDDPSTPESFQPTKRNIMFGLEWLTANTSPGDALFFSYSGHGSQQEDPHGIEEDGMNETILPVDFRRNGMITDDEISERLVQTLPDGVRLTAVMDSCHSGTGLDLPYSWNAKKNMFEEETNPYHSLGDV